MPIVAPLGWRKNFSMIPRTGFLDTGLLLVGPSFFIAGKNTAWNKITNPPGGSVWQFSDDEAVFMSNVGQGGRGSFEHCCLDITTNGISTETSVGGVDPFDPLGPIALPFHDYYVFIMARNDGAGPNDWGLVISSGTVTSGGPSAQLQTVFPFWAAIMWVRTDATGRKFAYRLSKFDYKWQTAGGTYIILTQGLWYTPNSPNNLPWADASIAGKCSPNTSPFEIMLTSQTPGHRITIANNNHYGSTGLFQAVGPSSPGSPAGYAQGQISPTEGYPSVYCDDPAGYSFITGGWDDF